MAQHQDMFLERLDRIKSGSGNVTGTVHIGATSYDAAQNREFLKEHAPLSTRALRWLGRFSLALISGAGAVLIGRQLAFQFLQPDGPLADLVAQAGPLAAYGPFVMAALTGLILMVLLSLYRGSMPFAMMAGAAAVLLGETSMLERAPGLFTPLYIPAQTEQALQVLLQTLPV
jgi:hypothetical protein